MMTQLETINNKLEELDNLKDVIIEMILDTDELSKIEKLDIITNNNLWGTDTFVSEVFDGWQSECAEIEHQLAIADGKIEGKDYICGITDDAFLIDNDRHQMIYYRDLIAYLEPSDSILVATCRGAYKAKLYKSYDEIEDHIYNYAIENKSIGFELDW